MPPSSSRHLAHGAATLARAPTGAQSSTPSHSVHPHLIRRIHHRAAASSCPAAPPPRRSSSSSSRRDAHALASRVKFDSHPPPPPPPHPSTSARRSPVSKADPHPSAAGDWQAHLEASLPADRVNARHPKWDERGSETYDAEPVLPLDVDGRYRAAAEGDSIRADRAHEWDAEDEWLDVLRREAELEAQRDEVRQVRTARASSAVKVDQLPPDVPPAPPPSSPRAVVESVPLATTEARAPATNPFAVTRTTTPRRRPAPLRFEPVERTDPSLIAPYLPPPLSSTSLDPFPSPASDPLVTRHDWRLSSPLRRYLRRSPPPLFSRTETDTVSLGHNRLVGVGVDAARIAKYAQVRTEEQWGWKVRVPEAERGGWPDAEVYRKRLDRLLDLSKAADEQLYLASLARQGTPKEREPKGVTLMRALGTWLTDPSRADEMTRLDAREKEERRKAGSVTTAAAAAGTAGASVGAASAGAGQRAVACFEAEDGRELTEDKGWKFSTGTIVRLTLASEQDQGLARSGSTGPQPPPAASTPPPGSANKWFVQGTVLNVRDGNLIVAFDEVDLWPLGDEAYQIDIGLDTSSYALQTAAIDNLFLDPSRQRAHNATQVAAVQHAFTRSGIVPSLREWALQGTELREHIVPSSQPQPQPQPSRDLKVDPLKSDVLRQNQLINSWIERYRRDDPIELPGDPDLGLNASQTKAIAMALGDKLSLIQGPPGTGKSQTIVSLIALLKLHFRIPSPILLAAPTHVSVDHLVLLLVRAGLNPLRCGKAAKVSNEVHKWTIEKRQEQHPLWDRLEKAREECEALRTELQDMRDAKRDVGGYGGGKEADDKDSEVEGKYRKAWRKFIMLEHKLYSSLLATADVFCATALGSGASKVLNMVDFPIVLLDEAAMCTEPVSLIPLMKGARQATLIGDHKQLPAVVTSQDAKNERLHLSLFERLLTSKTVNSTLLDTQYRMRPSISSFPNQSFYNGALLDAESVSSRPAPLNSVYFGAPSATSAMLSAPHTPPPASRADGHHEPVAFVSHTGPETVHRQSLLNRTESNILISIVGDLLRRNPTLRATDIGIISPYYAQTRLLVNTFESGYAASRLRTLLGAERAAEAGEVEVNTVDGFQGREKRVVLLSTVRCNLGGYIGFLTDRRRLNVALTRAKDALIVVGNERTLRKAAGLARPRDLDLGRDNFGDDDEFDLAPSVRAPVQKGDPDADAGVWTRFLDWCARRGLVRQWEEEEQAPASTARRA
ncbi:hypothetical protein JCM3775_000127 [Rhodotorula graminis]